MAGMRGSDGTGGTGGAKPSDAARQAGDADEWGESDELEIEVTDLWTGATVERTIASPPAQRRRSPTAPADLDYGDEDDENGENGEDEDGEAAAAKPPAAFDVAARRRRRGARTALVALAVALVPLMLLVSNPGVTTALQTRFFPPTPTLAAGADTVWFHNVVPWGRLMIDGRAPSAPDTSTPLELSRGRHNLTYEAPPFATLRCTVSVPRSPLDTCPQDTNTQDEGNPPPAGERTLDLRAAPQKLSPGSYMALVAALQSLLNPATTTTQLAPGDHYGAPGGQVMVAERAMVVSLGFVVAPASSSGTAISSISINGTSCNPLCVVPNGVSSYVTGWPVSAEVLPQWRYVDDGGVTQEITTAAPGNGQTLGGPGSLLTFSVQWKNGGWLAALPEVNNYNSLNGVGSVECEAAMQALPALPTTNAGVNDGYGIETGPNTAATPLADGCAIAVIPQSASGPPNVPSALLLVRCGALIAANDLARKLFPSLPIADDREAALAQQLGRGLGN